MYVCLGKLFFSVSSLMFTVRKDKFIYCLHTLRHNFNGVKFLIASNFLTR